MGLNVFGYTSQRNVTRWRCFMKNCRANIFEKEKVIFATKFFIYKKNKYIYLIIYL
jgi:hypothetical protein